MSDIIDFNVERAKRKSGFKDTVLIKDIISEGYDPCDYIEVQNYYAWKNFQGFIDTDVDIEHNWTDESLDKLMQDIKMWNDTENTTVTVEYDPKIFE